MLLRPFSHAVYVVRTVENADQLNDNYWLFCWTVEPVAFLRRFEISVASALEDFSESVYDPG